MARKLWTAAEMEKRSRTEQQAVFEASIVTDLAEVPPAFLAAIRHKAERLIAAHEPLQPD